MTHSGSLPRERIREQRSLTRTYLEKHFGALKEIGIVDIGWRGSIQDNLAHLYPERRFHGHYLGLAPWFNPQSPNGTKSAYGPDLNQSTNHRELMNAVDLMEMLCNSAGGTTRGYRESEQGIEAVREVNPAENRAWETYSGQFQAGVLEAASDATVRQILEEIDADHPARGRAAALGRDPEPAAARIGGDVLFLEARRGVWFGEPSTGSPGFPIAPS